MNTSGYLHTLILSLVMALNIAMNVNTAIASDHEIPSRLIIGFYPDAYRSLGGAGEATDYINNQWGDRKLISLVRPMGNSSILVEIVNPDSANLNQIISKLMDMEKIRSVDEDLPVSHFSAPNAHSER